MKKKKQKAPRMISRASIINGLQTKLSMPRIQISIILLLTAAVGFLTSIILLAVGMTDMALRYPLAVVMAYLTFLILLRIWLWLQDERSSIGDITNIGDIGGTDLYIPNIGGGGGSTAGRRAGVRGGTACSRHRPGAGGDQNVALNPSRQVRPIGLPI